MNRRLTGATLGALADFLGRWSGTTRWEATAWGPARSAAAEVEFARAAGGLAVTVAFRHAEADGGVATVTGVLTEDPRHPGALLYEIHGARAGVVGLPLEGRAPDAPARAAWHDGVLTIERRSARGTARHTLQVRDGELIHSAGLRLGAAGEFTPVMTTVCRRVRAAAPV
ncbi:DUF1579 domain-containing protein [Arthrobacter sp. NPDC080082]|uniref:DUF1579 domain-containing protein n=1 Tax=unclassified Arthrobacter TaxID=235627 RepID=UPI00342CE355